MKLTQFVVKYLSKFTEPKQGLKEKCPMLIYDFKEMINIIYS